MQFARKILPLLVVMSLPALMVGCGGDDGKNGVNGTNGTNGANGSAGASGADGKTRLFKQTVLMAGDTQCFGGVKADFVVVDIATQTIICVGTKEGSLGSPPFSLLLKLCAIVN